MARREALGRSGRTGRLEGKVALVTGGARGIGAAIARRFAEEGATLVVNDLDPVGAEKLAAEIGGIGIGADVSDSAAVSAMFERVAEHHRGLDVLVNNAGISGVEGQDALVEYVCSIQERQAQDALAGRETEAHLDAVTLCSDADWRRMLGVHLDGTFFCTREALKQMHGRPGANIINMASIMGTSGGAFAAAYSAAKAGILGFTRAVAREIASRRIRVNAIAPGWIATDMTDPLAPMHPQLRVQTPLNRLGDVDDIAWAAVYLASDEAKFVTGQVLSPNGGWTMSQ